MKITASVFSVGCIVNLFLPFGFAELRGTATSSKHKSHDKVVEGTLINDDRYHDRIDEIRSITTATATANIDINDSNGIGRKLEPSGAVTTVPDDYPSLSDALNAGQQNIYIKDGTYDVESTIQISTPHIRIQGESRDGTILRYTGSASFLLVTDTTNVTVSSLTLDAKTFDVPETNEIWEAFGAVNVHETTLKDCNVYGSNHMFAVFFAGPSGYDAGQPTIDMFDDDILDANNVVEGNYIRSDFPGDVLSFSLQKDGIVKRNKVEGGVISFFMNKNSHCSFNTVVDSSTWGIFVSVPAEQNYIKNNKIIRSQSSAIKVARQIDHRDEDGEIVTPFEYRAPGIFIARNQIFDTRFFGIEVDQTVGALIDSNYISHVDFTGIYILRNDKSIVRNNRIEDYGQEAHRETIYPGWTTSQNSGIYGDVDTVRARIVQNTIVNATSEGTRFGIKIPDWASNVRNVVRRNTVIGDMTYNEIDVPPNANKAENNEIF